MDEEQFEEISKERRVSPENQYSELEDKYREKLPKNWEDMSLSLRLDWFAHRMLLDLREETGREGSRDWGFLSEYQLERRRRREVQSKLGSWDEHPAKQGMFRRVHIDKNNLVINREDKQENGQKNP